MILYVNSGGAPVEVDEASLIAAHEFCPAQRAPNIGFVTMTRFDCDPRPP